MGIGLGIYAATLGALGSWYQARQAAKVAKYNTDATNAANQRMAEYAYSRDVEMMNRTNAYNSPEQQMERLKNAGLNPNLIYGSGGSVGNMSGAAPKYQAPTMQYAYKPGIDLPGMIGMYQDVAMKAAQTDQIRAQTNLTEQSTLNAQVMERIQKLKEFGVPYDNASKWNKIQKEQKDLNYQQQFLEQKARKQELEIGMYGSKQENLDTQTEKRRAEIIFQQYKNDLLKMGITTSDDVRFRVMLQMLNASGVKLPNPD